MSTMAGSGPRRECRAPVRPAHPERVCWGCEKFCPAHDLACGNGTIRTLHPAELFGEDWLEWVSGSERRPDAPRTEPDEEAGVSAPATAGELV